MGVAEQINALREALADNWSVTVFPEGTTTDSQLAAAVQDQPCCACSNPRRRA